jgi:hypothetical protein
MTYVKSIQNMLNIYVHKIYYVYRSTRTMAIYSDTIIYGFNWSK